MNKVILLGRLVKDPEIRTTQNGKEVATFTIAVNRKVAKDQQQQADFIPIVVWGKIATVCGKYLLKGKQVAIEGRIQVRNYTAQDGTKKYVTEVLADNVEFVGSKNDTSNNSAVNNISNGFGTTVNPNDVEIPF